MNSPEGQFRHPPGVIDIIHWANRVADTRSPGEGRVLLALADHCNAQGFTDVSLDRVAAECRTSRRTVETHVRALLDRGVIARKFRRHRSCVYRLPDAAEARRLVIAGTETERGSQPSGSEETADPEVPSSLGSGSENLSGSRSSGSEKSSDPQGSRSEDFASTIGKFCIHDRKNFPPIRSEEGEEEGDTPPTPLRRDGDRAAPLDGSGDGGGHADDHVPSDASATAIGEVIPPPDPAEIAEARDRIAAALDPARGAPVARPFSDREIASTVALGMRLGLPLGVVVEVVEGAAADPPGGLIRSSGLIERRLRDAADYRAALPPEEIERRQREGEATWRPPRREAPPPGRRGSSPLAEAAARLIARYRAEAEGAASQLPPAQGDPP